MDRPPLLGIQEPKPFPRWRLAAVLILLPTLAGIYGLLIRKEPVQVPVMNGFLFLHWLVPTLLALVGVLWVLRVWNRPQLQKATFWSILTLLLLMLAGIVSWMQMRQFQRKWDGPYSSRLEYAPLLRRPSDWPDPTHPEVYEVGSGLRLAMSTVVFTDRLHRSLPRTAPTDPEPYPESGGPRPLSDLGQRNLEVFLKTSALIRFFHPTDAAGFSGWDRLIAQGVRQVEDAPTLEDLVQRIQVLLSPYAPQARLLLPGEPLPIFQVPEGSSLVVRWRHLGVGFDCLRLSFSGATRDRSIRMAGVGMAWSTLKHFYPYWEVTPGDWDTCLPVALKEAALASNNTEYVAVLQRMLSHLKDGHGTLEDISNQGRNPQVLLEMMDGHAIIAQRWGKARALPLGGEILKVDGVAVDQRFADLRSRAQASTTDFAEDEVAWRLLQAPPNQTIEVEVSDLGGHRSVHHLTSQTNWAEGRPLPEPIREATSGVFIVDLSRVDEATFSTALPNLVAARGLIFDLRGYPRDKEFLAHFRSTPLAGALILIPNSPRPEGLGRTYTKRTFTIQPEKPTYKGRAVFLAGARTISFGETCLEVVAANNLGPIVGSATAGTNGNYREFNLPGNIICRFTGMKVLRADGSRQHGIGIQPTHPVKHTREALAAGRDEDVERALALIESGR